MNGQLHGIDEKLKGLMLGGTFTPVPGTMGSARIEHSAILFPNGALGGKVLLAGGVNLSGSGTGIAGLNEDSTNTADIYDPGSGTAGSLTATTGTMHESRGGHAAALLTTGSNAGQVIVAGGEHCVATACVVVSSSSDVTSPAVPAELFDPSTQSWTALTSAMIPPVNAPAGFGVMLADPTGGTSRTATSIVVATPTPIPIAAVPPVPATLVVTPRRIGFPAEVVIANNGAPSRPFKVTVSNPRNHKQDQTIQIIGTTISPVDFEIDPATTTCGPSLPAGQKCQYGIIFRPSTLEGRSGTFTVNSNSSIAPSHSVALAGTGKPGVLVLQPKGLHFAKQPTNSPSASKRVTVDNVNPVPMEIAVSIGGDFAITGNTCPTPPAMLAAESTCQVMVDFDPTTTGKRLGAVTFTDQAKGMTQQVNLVGVGAPGDPSAAPTPTSTASGGTSTPTPIPSGGATPNPSANIQVNASVVTGVNPHVERDGSQIYMPRGPNDIALLSAIHRTHVRGFWYAPWTTGATPGQYNWNPVPGGGETGCDPYGSEDCAQAQMASYGVTPVLCIAGRPTWDGGGVYGYPTNLPAYTQLIYDGLEHFKQNNDIPYLEVLNEPDANGVPASTYCDIYGAAVEGVQHVNADIDAGINGTAGKTHVKIGGPTTSNFPQSYIQSLISCAQTHGYPLDFISDHPYLPYATNPAGQRTEVNLIRGWLKAAGFPHAEIHQTEWATTGSQGGYDLNSVAYGAGYQAAGFYQFTQAYLDDLTMPVHQYMFADLDDIVFSQSLLDNGGAHHPAPLPPDGTTMPGYMVSLEYSMLKSNLVSSVSDSLNSNGTGVGAIGSVDDSGVAVLIFNYSAGSATKTLSVGGLPGGFSSYHVQQYLVDGTHSNRLYNGTNTLEKVADFTASSQPYDQTLSLSPYSENLFIFTPTGTASARSSGS